MPDWIVEDDVERFTAGDCHVLAHVLSQLTGWDIWAFNVYGQPDYHAFVRTPSRYILDIEGLHRDVRAFKELWSALCGEDEATPPRLMRTSHAECAKRWGHAEMFPGSWARAREVAPALLAEAGFHA